VAVRGGGHNIAGRSVPEGGVMIDLAEMKGMYVDPARRTIRAQGGVIWSEFNRGDGGARPRRDRRRGLHDRGRRPHARSPEQAQNDLAPLREFGSPLMVELGPMPYPVMNTLLDDGFPRGLIYWKSSFVGAPTTS